MHNRIQKVRFADAVALSGNARCPIGKAAAVCPLQVLEKDRKARSDAQRLIIRKVGRAQRSTARMGKDTGHTTVPGGFDRFQDHPGALGPNVQGALDPQRLRPVPDDPCDSRTFYMRH